MNLEYLKQLRSQRWSDINEWCKENDILRVDKVREQDPFIIGLTWAIREIEQTALDHSAQP